MTNSTVFGHPDLSAGFKWPFQQMSKYITLKKGETSVLIIFDFAQQKKLSNSKPQVAGNAFAKHFQFFTYFIFMKIPIL